MATTPDTPRADWLASWRESTVALGKTEVALVKKPDGTTEKKNVFVVVGTGVLLGRTDDPTKTPWLVTAKHVFSNPKESWAPSSLQMRFSWFATRPVDEYVGIRIPLRDAQRDLWISHPDAGVDLACVPLRISVAEAGRAEAPGVLLEGFASPDEIFQGAQVLVLGYPGAVGPAFWTEAVARQGIIAWLAPTKPAEHPMLIDADVFPGNSGGPAFRLPSGMDRFGTFVIGGRVAFLGIVSQARLDFQPVQAGGKTIELPGPKPLTVLAPNFTGIAVVEPAHRVRELLEYAAKKVAQ